MLASEFIQRLHELVRITGDVPVILEKTDGRFEIPLVETQNVTRVADDPISFSEATDDGDFQTVIKVW